MISSNYIVDFEYPSMAISATERKIYKIVGHAEIEKNSKTISSHEILKKMPKLNLNFLSLLNFWIFFLYYKQS